MNDFIKNLDLKEIDEFEKSTRDRLNFYTMKLAENENLSPYERAALRSKIRSDTAQIKKWRFKMWQTVNKLGEPLDEVETSLRELEGLEKRHLWLLKTPPNALIDYEEQKTHHFAQGISFYKLFWMLFFGSFVGVGIEVLWCLLKNGYIENRTGLVYGPFNLVYGFGAVALTLALFKYRNRSKWYSFIGGAIAGSVVEYSCSLFQETFLGSTSWDYSSKPFNINGRICPEYALYWGILGVFWIKWLYPRLAQLIMKIPNKSGKVITWVLLSFMLVNTVVSAAAVYRWKERTSGESPSNAIEELLDDRFDDKRMESIYPTLKFGYGE